ncbi:hypothetical protein F4604DRAFT_1289139 [Suillus subluteus]|nr:hypothetical protein F4604DRAFT_1289139 [Suillus subluteus]
MYTHPVGHIYGIVIFFMPSNFVDFTSLLVQSLLDLVVNSALEVVDAFHEKILQLEYDVLMKPDMKVVSRCPFLFVLTTPKLVYILSGVLHCSRLLGKRFKSKGERK